MSFDPPEENQAWAEEEYFEFELWTDEGRELAMYYGAATSPTALSARRVTMLLDDQGILRLEYVDSIDTGTHPAQVLEDCEKLFGP